MPADAERIERYVVAARLKPREIGAAERLLSAGPPFDPAAAELSIHEAYLDEHHVYLVFEGEGARTKALNLARKHLLDVAVWQGIIDDLPSRVPDVPRTARSVYSWSRGLNPTRS